jgi:hypothetical protein
MRIEVNETDLNFKVVFSSSDREHFETMLTRFKSAIPKKCRRFDDDQWTVAMRSRRALEEFLQVMEGAGAAIERRRTRGMTRPAPARLPVQEPALGYLVAEDEKTNGSSLIYRATQRRHGRASVILRKMPRWASIGATMAERALTDGAKQLIFYSLIEACLPGGRVRVSNRTVNATMLSFNAARQFAGWLGAVMNDEKNKTGSKYGREHARLEAERRMDGSLRMLQSGKPAKGEAA